MNPGACVCECACVVCDKRKESARAQQPPPSSQPYSLCVAPAEQQDWGCQSAVLNEHLIPAHQELVELRKDTTAGICEGVCVPVTWW